MVGLPADWFGRFNLFSITICLSCVSSIGFWVPSVVIGDSHESVAKSLFIGFIVIYGLFTSAYVGLFFPALAELFGFTIMPRLAGVLYMMGDAVGLVTAPVAGILLRAHDSAGDSAQDYFSMATLCSPDGRFCSHRYLGEGRGKIRE